MYRDTNTSPLVITAFNGRVVALARDTGTVAWSVQLVGGGGSVRLHVDAHRVVALGAQELAVMAYLDGKVLLRTQVPNGTLLVDGDTAFVSNAGELSAIDLQTGELRWNNTLPRTGYGVASIGVPSHTVQADVHG